MKTDLISEEVDQAELDQIQSIQGIGDAYKLNLILMKLGCKKATCICFEKNEGELNARVRKELESLGFFCEWNSENPNIPDTAIELEVTIDRKDLNFLISNNFADNVSLGQLFGYPESAVVAFDPQNPSETLDTGEIPVEVRQAEWFELLCFRLSKENWREEVKTIEKWYELLKKYAPKLLKEYIDYKSEYRVFYEAELLRQRLAEASSQS